MEFQPDGIVHLKLDLPDGPHELYTWNKVRNSLNVIYFEKVQKLKNVTYDVTKTSKLQVDNLKKVPFLYFFSKFFDRFEY